MIMNHLSKLADRTAPWRPTYGGQSLDVMVRLINENTIKDSVLLDVFLSEDCYCT